MKIVRLVLASFALCSILVLARNARSEDVSYSKPLFIHFDVTYIFRGGTAFGAQHSRKQYGSICRNYGGMSGNHWCWEYGSRTLHMRIPEIAWEAADQIAWIIKPRTFATYRSLELQFPPVLKYQRRPIAELTFQQKGTKSLFLIEIRR